MSNASGCVGKIAYRSHSEANRALGRVKDRLGEGDGLNAYACRACSGWHLGRKGWLAKKPLPRIPDWRRDSHKARRQRWAQLVEGE